LFIWAAGIAVGLYLLHRIALWAESRGYIYYVNTEPSRNSIGNAFLEAQSLVEPDKRALIQVIREERSEQAEAGAPPDPEEIVDPEKRTPRRKF
jgi:hypothetical protein